MIPEEKALRKQLKLQRRQTEALRAQQKKEAQEQEFRNRLDQVQDEFKARFPGALVRVFLHRDQPAPHTLDDVFIEVTHTQVASGPGEPDQDLLTKTGLKACPKCVNTTTTYTVA